MTEQLGLFGQPAEPGDGGRRRRRPVEPAPPTPALLATADALPRHVRLGTSSWSFPGWAGLVWAAGDRPPARARLAREGLPAYARHPLLRAVGIDRTFYAPVPEETFRAWAGDVPGDFRFLVKAPRSAVEPRTIDGAPNAAFLDAARLDAELLAPAVAGLGPRLGVIVLQFPPVPFRRSDGPDRLLDRLAAFLRAVRARTEAPVAVEVRNRVLLEGDRLEAYRAALDAADAAHAYTVHPSMPPVAAQVAALPPRGRGPVAVRWMLRGARPTPRPASDSSPSTGSSTPIPPSGRRSRRSPAARSSAARSSSPTTRPRAPRPARCTGWPRRSSTSSAGRPADRSPGPTPGRAAHAARGGPGNAPRAAQPQAGGGVRPSSGHPRASPVPRSQSS